MVSLVYEVTTMFLGSVIYDKRRTLNLTQNDLADGLCNQNTISKMEKHNMTPQIDVLIKICHRLDLSLNDVFSDFSSDIKQEQIFILDEIEEDVLLNNLHEIAEKLSIVKSSINAKDMAQYDFIQAVLAFQHQEYEMSSFNLDKVIQETKADNDNIYTLTSYLLKGMIYSKQDHLDMAAYYFKIVLPKKKLEQADDIEDFEFEGYDEAGEESELDNDDEDYSDDTEE